MAFTVSPLSHMHMHALTHINTASHTGEFTVCSPVTVGHRVCLQELDISDTLNGHTKNGHRLSMLW